MSNARAITALFAVAVLASGCALADFYDDQEYVLYDSSAPAAKGSAEREEEDRIAAQTDATAEDADVSGDLAIKRIFVLQNLRDELDRALRDGVGDAAVVQRKRDDVSRELEWRVAEAGEGYTTARSERLVRLQAFPVVIR